jgi:hypothetical protein
MALAHRVVRALVFFFLLSSPPLFAIRKGDVGSSANGQFGNCPATPEGGPCPVLNSQGSIPLAGTDASGNSVTVTIYLYDWGFFPCNQNSCQPLPNITNAVLDVVLTGTDTTGIQSLVVQGALTSPGYVSCGGSVPPGLGCVLGPAPDESSDIQEPTSISAADAGASTNTRWDFGGVPPSSPPLPAIPFDQLICSSDDHDAICGGTSPTLGEAILTVSNSVASNNLTTNSSNYLVTLTDGTQLGNTNLVPVSPTENAAVINNTQSTATVVTTSSGSFHDYTNTALAYPQMNADGTPNCPGPSCPANFALAPVPPPASASLPSCYPTNAQTFNPINAQGGTSVASASDYRTFRTVWYTYTPPSNGSVTIDTAGSRYDTLVYVFTGSASQPSTVACDDDPPVGGSLQAATTFNVTQSTPYQIVV